MTRSGTRCDKYLEPSPYEVDGGEKVGKLPTCIPIAELRELGHPESPVKAIRAKCTDCSGGSVGEVRKCVSYGCPLWPFRMGVSPFFGKKDDGIGDEVSAQTRPEAPNEEK